MTLPLPVRLFLKASAAFLAMALILWNLNPSEWSPATRFVTLLIFYVLAADELPPK